jgi:mitochondrial fission protein ELM1
VNTQAEASLDVLLLSDGRPGHYHLAEGVVAAIAGRRPVTTRRLELAKPRLPLRVAALWLAFGGDPARVLRLAHGLGPADLVPPAGVGRPGLVVSAGGDTLAALATVARLLAVPSIFCGTLRHLGPEHVSLVVTSYARHAGRPRHLVALKPGPFEPPATARRDPLTGPPHLAGLLVGGNSGKFHYTAAEWEALLVLLVHCRREHGTRWIVSTSRRTDPAVADRLVALAAEPEGPIERLIDFRTAGPGTLPNLLAAVDAVVVTEDSSTMLSEAISAGLPVVGVAPVRHGFKDEEREYRAYLRDSGWCRFLPIALLSPAALNAALVEVRPLRESPRERLAEEIARRLPALFAP